MQPLESVMQAGAVLLKAEVRVGRQRVGRRLPSGRTDGVKRHVRIAPGSIVVLEDRWQVRRADVGDAVALTRLNQHVQVLHVAAEPDDFHELDPAEAVAFFATLLEDPTHLVLIATNARQPAIGYVWAQDHERPTNPFTKPARTMYIHHVVVTPSARGQGVGRSLVAAVEAECRQRGITRVALDHWTFNEPAHRFFAGLGYVPYNVRMRRELGGMDADDS